MTDVDLAQCNRRCFAFRNREDLSKSRYFQPSKHVPSTRLQIRKSRRGYNRILDTVLYRISAYRQANPHPRQRELCRFPYLPLLQVSHSSIRESWGGKATLSQKRPPSRFRQDAAGRTVGQKSLRCAFEKSNTNHKCENPSMPLIASGLRYSFSKTILPTVATFPHWRGMPNFSLKGVKMCAIGLISIIDSEEIIALFLRFS